MNQENTPRVRALDFEEELAVSAYEKAVTDALSSADSAAGRVLTASFSILTAYGALVGLVAPEDDPQPFLIALPFLFLLAAALLSVRSLTRAIDFRISKDLGTIESRVADTVSSKRRPLWWAVLWLTVGIAVAGLVVIDSYAGAEATPDDLSVEVWVVGDAADRITELCDLNAPVILGSARPDAVESSDSDFLEIAPSDGTCGEVARLNVPRSEIVALVVFE